MAKTVWILPRKVSASWPGCDGSVDFQVPEHALDTVVLFVEGAVVLDRHTAARLFGYDCLDAPCCLIHTDGAGLMAFLYHPGIECVRVGSSTPLRLCSSSFCRRSDGRRLVVRGRQSRTEAYWRTAPRTVKCSSISPAFQAAAETWREARCYRGCNGRCLQWHRLAATPPPARSRLHSTAERVDRSCSSCLIWARHLAMAFRSAAAEWPFD